LIAQRRQRTTGLNVYPSRPNIDRLVLIETAIAKGEPLPAGMAAAPLATDARFRGTPNAAGSDSIEVDRVIRAMPMAM
jgi:hypothetical protein